MMTKEQKREKALEYGVKIFPALVLSRDIEVHAMYMKEGVTKEDKHFELAREAVGLVMEMIDCLEENY